MNPNDLQTLLQPLEAALGSLSPQDWLQFASVAVLSWLGGRAIQGRQEGGDAECRDAPHGAHKFRAITSFHSSKGMNGTSASVSTG